MRAPQPGEREEFGCDAVGGVAVVLPRQMTRERIFRSHVRHFAGCQKLGIEAVMPGALMRLLKKDSPR